MKSTTKHTTFTSCRPSTSKVTKRAMIHFEKNATTDKNPIVCAIERIYGGLNMSWRNVILFAVGTAVLTSVFLIVPIFKNTSFIRMGVTLESWIFFAIIIMANCNKQEITKNAGFFEKIKEPLICAAKVFVFFLISQPLIYLFEVPFKDKTL